MVYASRSVLCVHDYSLPLYAPMFINILFSSTRRLRLKSYEGTRAETIFLSAKRTSPFKSAGASVQSITGSRGVHISGSNTPCSEIV
jgi:hypothetical protein